VTTKSLLNPPRGVSRFLSPNFFLISAYPYLSLSVHFTRHIFSPGRLGLFFTVTQPFDPYDRRRMGPGEVNVSTVYDSQIPFPFLSPSSGK